jgi:hypothetical protein
MAKRAAARVAVVKSPSHFTFPKILCRIWNFLAPLREGRTRLRAVLQRGSGFPRHRNEPGLSSEGGAQEARQARPERVAGGGDCRMHVKEADYGVAIC